MIHMVRVVLTEHPQLAVLGGFGHPVLLCYSAGGVLCYCVIVLLLYVYIHTRGRCSAGGVGRCGSPCGD
jgi:hypothetical protein